MSPLTDQHRRHPDLFTKGEAAVYLHLVDDPKDAGAENLIQNLRERHLLQGIRLGKEYMYTRRELDALVQSLDVMLTGKKREMPIKRIGHGNNDGPKLRLAGGAV